MAILKLVKLRGLGKKYNGKVRDCYAVHDKRILIATDRISAFDRVLDYIPYKGQVLTLLSKFWFEQTADIVLNQMIVVPHANVMIAYQAEPIPLEIVVRGYISGVTNTSIWEAYEKGERLIYGIKFPDGLRKNQKLMQPVITPTTKASKGHDKKITKQEIIKCKILTPKKYAELEQIALSLFKRGTEICAKAGIILVDTKYEFGLYKGKLMLIDEIHTPDSSRFWIRQTYKERFKNGEEPENFDKEFMRIWFKKKGYTGDGNPPIMSKSFIDKISKRYIVIYEIITGMKYVPDKRKITKELILKAF